MWNEVTTVTETRIRGSQLSRCRHKFPHKPVFFINDDLKPSHNEIIKIQMLGRKLYDLPAPNS